MQVSRGRRVSRVGWDSFSERVLPAVRRLSADELEQVFTRASDGKVRPGPVRLFWRLGADGLPDAGWSGMVLDTRDGRRRRLYVAPDAGEAA